MIDCDFGFRIVGDCSRERRLVSWSAAFTGYADCDQRAEVEREGYLSAFTFAADFREYLDTHQTPKGFGGVCCAPWLWFDLDREGDLDAALRDALRLGAFLMERFRLDDADLLTFFSGSKGFHLGIPTELWRPYPSNKFHRVARRFAEGLANAAGVVIDSGVYDRVRAFRAPNSRHPKTGLHKRRFSFDELRGLTVARILELAGTPERFDIPFNDACSERAVADWNAATEAVDREALAVMERRQVSQGTPTLNRTTLGFIREGATAGDRHRLLFSAAANLAEFGCPSPLAHALLTEAALDSGLRPSDVSRQIECGLAYRAPEGGAT